MYATMKLRLWTDVLALISQEWKFIPYKHSDGEHVHHILAATKPSDSDGELRRDPLEAPYDPLADAWSVQGAAGYVMVKVFGVDPVTEMSHAIDFVISDFTEMCKELHGTKFDVEDPPHSVVVEVLRKVIEKFTAEANGIIWQAPKPRIRVDVKTSKKLPVITAADPVPAKDTSKM